MVAFRKVGGTGQGVVGAQIKVKQLHVSNNGQLSCGHYTFVRS